MKVRSIKTNYILSVLRIVSSTLIGIFTMPYINEVLGPTSLGKVEYVNSIITYFILFSALGIPVYGIRQIAKVRDDKNELSKTIVEILTILFTTSIIAYIILFSVLYCFGLFQDYQTLIILMSSMIILNNLGAEWFFQGIEDQLYITIRYLVVRIITVILLFVLVKNASDYVYYAGIVVLNFCGSNFLNFFRLKKYIQLKDIVFEKLNFVRHLKPSLTIFVASVSISIYLQIDVFLLGYLAGDEFVGLYSVSNKLLRYVITFIVSIGAVLLPRLSNYWNTDKNKYEEYLLKAFQFLLLISIPSSLYFYFFSHDIINIMAGDQFNEAILTLKLLSPVCFLVAMAYFFGYLVLYAQGKEKLYTIAVSVSALFSIVINYFLIAKYQQNGAAFTQLLAEFLSILIIVVFLKQNTLLKKILNKNSLKIIVANVFLFLIFFYLADEKINFSVYSFILNTSIFGLLYLATIIVLKENLTKSLFTNYLLKNLKK